MSLAVGDPAPDFELRGVHGATGEAGTWHLAELFGAPIVLVFYPADNSPVCTAQLEAYTREIADFDDVGATVLALSPQSLDSHRHFAAQQGGFAFALLSDQDKAVARSFGVLGLLDLYRRCTFVIDSSGTVSWLHRSIGPGVGFKPVPELVAAVIAPRPADGSA